MTDESIGTRSPDIYNRAQWFERIVEQHQAITTALCLSNRNDLCLSAADVKLLEESLSVLQPFEAATREIFADQYVSISKAIPLARSLQHLTAGSSHQTSHVWLFP